MKNKNHLIIKVLFAILLLVGIGSCTKQVNKKAEFGLVIHGGAGSITPGRYTPEHEQEYKDKLNEALDVGYKILSEGGTSLEAVEKVINVMEDSPLFNAGKGAVFTANEINELDASIMDGKTLNAGSVARLTRIKNPISLACKVMEESKHVMMVGNGAEIFAEQNGFEFVEPGYFYTERRWESLQKVKEKERNSADESAFLFSDPESKFGTVGCAALDKNGNLAAGTSTGGMPNKKFGRVGDSPIIGAGTYANNNTCAVSATGHGEYFIRGVVTHDISALMEYRNMSLKNAAGQVLDKLKKLGGSGGVIAIDKNGNVAMPFTTAGMFRGYKLANGETVVKMYRN